MDFETKLVETLPRLAWLVAVDKALHKCHAIHGSSVEIFSDGIVEGVWDDTFSVSGFCRAENFFGSGMRVQDETIEFVTSTALVDRLVYAETDGELIVSNSLPLLLANTGAELDVHHSYQRELKSILDGVHHYDPKLRVVHDEFDCVYQIYYHRLVYANQLTETRLRVGRQQELADFDQYIAFLSGVLTRIHENARAKERRFLIREYTTLSSGYDSTAVSALVREIGVSDFFSAGRPGGITSHIPLEMFRDSGRRAARSLGLTPVPNIRKPPAEKELLYFAGAAEPPEIALLPFLHWMEEHNRASILYTGYHGDKLWDLNTSERYLDSSIRRGDISGVSLIEARLTAGVSNVAIPFIAAHRIKSILAISRSRDMQPWKMSNDYDRPIPRRIAEAAGVPRESFGLRKKAITNAYHLPVGRAIRQDFFAFLRSKDMSPIALQASIPLSYLRYLIGRVSGNPSVKGHVQLFDLLFVWSNTRLAERYRAGGAAFD